MTLEPVPQRCRTGAHGAYYRDGLWRCRACTWTRPQNPPLPSRQEATP